MSAPPTCCHTVTCWLKIRSLDAVCVIPVMFDLVSVKTLRGEQEAMSIRVCWDPLPGTDATPGITERDSAQTECVLTRLVVHSPPP